MEHITLVQFLQYIIYKNNRIMKKSYSFILVLILMKVCQNSHLLFYAQSPDFHKLGLCYNLKILYL